MGSRFRSRLAGSAPRLPTTTRSHSLTPMPPAQLLPMTIKAGISLQQRLSFFRRCIQIRASKPSVAHSSKREQRIRSSTIWLENGDRRMCCTGSSINVRLQTLTRVMQVLTNSGFGDNASEDPKLQTMYWDCIFMANIWMTAPTPLRSTFKRMATFSAFDPRKADLARSIRESFAALERELDARKRQFENHVGNVLAQLSKINLESGLSAAAEAARRAAEDAVRQAQQAAAATTEAARRADEERRRLENEARQLKERVCKWCP